MDYKVNDIVEIVTRRMDKATAIVFNVAEDKVTIMQKENSFIYDTETGYLTNLQTSACISIRSLNIIGNCMQGTTMSKDFLLKNTEIGRNHAKNLGFDIMDIEAKKDYPYLYLWDDGMGTFSKNIPNILTDDYTYIPEDVFKNINFIDFV